MAMHIRDMAGLRVGMLTVKEMVPHTTKGDPIRWVCVCDCGRQHLRTRASLHRGGGHNCPCKPWRSVVRIGDISRTHGKSKSSTYNSWRAMNERCHNKGAPQFADYGGRGIKVCERWRSFENFLADMGERPPGKTIDRKDVNGDYEPDNCAWATSKQQNRNKKSNRLIEHAGITLCLSEWAESVGIRYGRLYDRLNKLGWSFEKAIRTPARPITKRSL
jgi:hypothetical protein